MITYSARTPPAFHPGMTILRVKGGSPPTFLSGKSFSFFYLERHAQIQNHRLTPSGRKVRGRKEEERKKEGTNNAKFSGHYVCAHALRSDQLWLKYMVAHKTN